MTNLSTSSSRTQLSTPKTPPQRPPRQPQKKSWYRRSQDILGAVAIVALLELGLHVAIDKLHVAGLDSIEKQQGLTMRADNIDHAIEMAEQADVINVAVIGSSIADGIDTAQLSKQTNNSSIDYFKLVGADSRGTSIMLKNIILPNTHVNWVVYMMSPHDINALSPVEERNVSIPGIDAYAKNPLIYKLSRKIESHLYLFRYRGTIVQALPSLSSVLHLLKNRGQAASAAAPEVPYDAAYVQFKEAARFKGDLENIYQLCKEHDAQLVIVPIPTDPEVTSKEFQQAANVWLKSIEDFAKQRNIVFVNGFELINQSSQFRDTHHLSKEGVPIITEALDKAIQKAPK